jgi:hypothetical protein
VEARQPEEVVVIAIKKYLPLIQKKKKLKKLKTEIDLPTFTVEFEDPFLLMGKLIGKFCNEFTVFSVHLDRKVIG